jgi:hypothetical protein
MKIKSNLFEFEGSPIELLILNYWINNYKCRVVQQIVIDYTK